MDLENRAWRSRTVSVLIWGKSMSTYSAGRVTSSSKHHTTNPCWPLRITKSSSPWATHLMYQNFGVSIVMLNTPKVRRDECSKGPRMFRTLEGNRKGEHCFEKVGLPGGIVWIPRVPEYFSYFWVGEVRLSVPPNVNVTAIFIECSKKMVDASCWSIASIGTSSCLYLWCQS